MITNVTMTKIIMINDISQIIIKTIMISSITIIIIIYRSRVDGRSSLGASLIITIIIINAITKSIIKIIMITTVIIYRSRVDGRSSLGASLAVSTDSQTSPALTGSPQRQLIFANPVNFDEKSIKLKVNICKSGSFLGGDIH